MPTDVKAMLQEAAGAVSTLTPAEVKDRLERGGIRVIDVREADEWTKGHVSGALLVPRGMLELNADPASPYANAAICNDRETPIVTYCFRSPGFRALQSARTLADMGFKNVFAMPGGLTEWSAEGLPVER